MFLLLSLVACSDITLRPLPSDALTDTGDPSTDRAPLNLDAAGIPTIEAPAPDWIDIPCVVPGLTLFGEGTTSEGAWTEGALDVRLDYAEGDLDRCPGMHFASEPATLEFTLLDDGTWVLDLTSIVVGGAPEAIMPVTLIQPANVGMEVTTAVTYGQPGWNARVDLTNLNGTEWGPGYKVTGNVTYWL